MLYFVKRYQLLIASIFLCLLSLHLLTYNKRGIGGTLLVGRIISYIGTPMQSAMMDVKYGIREIWDDYIYLLRVKDENDLLKKRIDALTEERNRLIEEVRRYKRLKKIVELKETMDLKMIVAEIIGESTQGWTKTFFIDKGSRQGIKRKMAVVSARGIVGKIIEVQPEASRVLLVSDPRFRADVLLERNRVKGIIEGGANGGLVLKYVNELDDVRIGDRVITSGLGGIFPKGLLVGKISMISRGENNLFKEIEVTPSAPIKKLEDVFIIKSD